MEHARDAKEAEKVIELVRWHLCGEGEVVVKAFSVEAGDFLVLEAVVEKHFAVTILEMGEAGGPGADIRGVKGLGKSGGANGEGGGIPRRIVNDVLEPILERERSVSEAIILLVGALLPLNS